MIRSFANPLSNDTGIAKFINTNAERRASTRLALIMGDVSSLNVKIKYNVIGFSLDRLLKDKIIPDPPSIMKTDVDGIEHLILQGAKNTLKRFTVNLH